MSEIQALRDDVIVRPVYQAKFDKIFIPETARKFKLYDGQVWGEVVSIGKDYKQTYGGGQKLKTGDKVIWEKNEGKKIVYEGVEYLLLKSRWVHAVLKEDK